MSTKWGIASAGKISHDFVNALSTYGESSGHSVVAVAARSLDTAKEFAEKHNIPKAYEGKALFQASLKQPGRAYVHVPWSVPMICLVRVRTIESKSYI